MTKTTQQKTSVFGNIEDLTVFGVSSLQKQPSEVVASKPLTKRKEIERPSGDNEKQHVVSVDMEAVETLVRVIVVNVSVG